MSEDKQPTMQDLMDEIKSLKEKVSSLEMQLARFPVVHNVPVFVPVYRPVYPYYDPFPYSPSTPWYRCHETTC